MQLYLIIISLIVFAIITFLLLRSQRYVLLSDQLKNQLEHVSSQYNDMNIDYIKAQDIKNKIEKDYIIATQKLQEAEYKISEWEKVKSETMQYAKAAIFEVGQQLSSKLIEEHKRETLEAKLESKTKIDETSKQLQDQFQHILSVIATLNNQVKLSTETVDLVKNALLSPIGAGALAEITLENILISSGLQKDRDFFIQYEVKDSNYNNKLRPDAVVFLPAGNILVIDSKASKFFIELAASNPQFEKELLAELKNSMRTHLKTLSSKDYKEAVKSSIDPSREVKHISNIMFLPSESALEKLQFADKDFIQKAWELDIFPAGPIGIVNILTHAKFLISEEKQQHNYKIIHDEVRKLLLSINIMYDHIKRMGNAVHSVTNYYDKLAASFNSNILPKTRNLQKLGIDLPKNKNLQNNLERYQIIHTKDTIIELDENETMHITDE